MVHAACKAGLAEGVATRGGDRLEQQLHAQDAVSIISIIHSYQATLPAGWVRAAGAATAAAAAAAPNIGFQK
jgi:hypothetical protein